MIIFLLRDQLSYFQSYRNFFVAIYLAFLAFPAGGLIDIFLAQPTWMRLGLQGIGTSGSIIAIIWGYVATKLYLYPEPLSLRRFLSPPFRRIFLAFEIYLLPMIASLTLLWTTQSAIITGPSQNVIYVLEGTTLPSAILGPLLLVIGIMIVIGFTLYPLAVLTRRRALVKDREVRNALRLIASVFSAISVTLVFAIALSSQGYSLLGPANLLSVSLIIVAVRAFRKPTFLKSFLGVAPSLQSSPTASRYDQVLLIHGPGDEKLGPIAKYIIDGVNQKERIIYFQGGDVAQLTEDLSRQGVDVTRLMLKGSLRVPPLRSAYPSRGIIDDTALEVVNELEQEAKTLGSEGLRVILDYDDFVIRPMQKFVKHLTDPRWTRPDHSMHVLMAFDAAAFRGEEASLAELESKIRTLDLAESRDTFSQAVGLSHEEIMGRKILLEFDPQLDSEPVFKSILAETAANFERTVVFTRRESPLYSLVKKQPATKLFLLTSRVSYPKMESENLFLLPSYDSSLILDALNRTIDAYTGTTYTIIFDDLSHFVFTLGVERTYSLIRQSLELMISDKVTAVFSMNLKAHDARVMSTFQSMFDIELIYESGIKGPVVRRKTVLVG